MITDYLDVRVANLADPAGAAVVFLGSKANILSLTLRNRGVTRASLHSGQGGTPATLMEIALAANVPATAFAGAVPTIEIIGNGSFTDQAPADASFDPDRGVITIRPTKTFALERDWVLKITLRDVALPRDYSHVPVVLTVAWQDLRLADETGLAVDLPRRDGLALALQPRPAPGVRAGGGPAPLSVGWLSQAAGGKPTMDGRGLVVVTPPAPAPAAPEDLMQRLAQSSAVAAEQAHQDIVRAVGQPGYGAAIADARNAAALSRGYARLVATLPLVPVLAPPAPIANRLAFRLQNGSDAPLFIDDGSRRRPSFTIGMVTAESREDAWAYDALCSFAEAGDIQCRVYAPNHSEWGIERDRAKGQWILTPRSLDVLGPHEAIVVVLENLVTTMPAHPTGLYIAHRDLPGYDDGVLLLPVEKIDPRPTITEFAAFLDDLPVDPAAGILQGQEIELRWSCWGVPAGYGDAVTLLAEEATGDAVSTRVVARYLSASGRFREVPTATSTSYRLTLKVPAAPPDAYAKVRIAPVVLRTAVSDLAIARGESAAIVYSVSGATSVTLEPAGDPVPAAAGDPPGTGAFLVSPVANTSYRLQAEGHGGPAVANWFVAVRERAPRNELLFLTTAGLVDEIGLAVASPGPAAAADTMFTDAGYLFDFGMQDDTVRYVVGPVDGSDQRRLIPHDLRPFYESPTAFIPRLPVSLVTVRGVLSAATQNIPMDFAGGAVMPLDFFGDDPARRPWIFNDPFALDLVMDPIWYAPSDVGDVSLVTLVRHADGIGFLALDRATQLWRCPDQPNQPGTLVADKVESFAIDPSGTLYWVNMRHELMQSTLAGEGWTATKLLDVPGISTRIVCLDGTVHWAENDGRFGPMSCAWSLRDGYRQLRNLPGRVPFNGVALRCVTSLDEAERRPALG
jgi:hypothetical protein